MESFDLVVLGGGINGVAIACDAAGRGLSVCLCEQGDLACATSNWSTKLIHGGLRYLEQYEFSLVKKALKEREVLMKKAPFLVRPLEFILPYERQRRPAWVLQCGLWLYDSLAWGGSLPRSKRLSLRHGLYGDALQSHYKTGFSYYDCQTDDARLVLLTARLAEEKGADIRLYTSCYQAVQMGDRWKVKLKDSHTGEFSEIEAKAIVNATGPWVEKVATDVIQSKVTANVTLVQGSHFVIPRCYHGDHAYIFQTSDKRVIFTIPYQKRFTLVGTTDQLYTGDLYEPYMSEEECSYLCREVSRYLKQPIDAEDIVWSYSGVRTLYSGGEDASASEISRDFHLTMDNDPNCAPAIHVYGGKITTHRVLAEDVMTHLKPYFPKIGRSWTATAVLPGGDLLGLSARQALESLQTQYSGLLDDMVQRYWLSYGMETRRLLQGCRVMSDLGQHFGAGLYQCEVDYLVEHEWARSVDDIIWRRSKLGLFLSPTEKKALEDYLLRSK